MSWEKVNGSYEHGGGKLIQLLTANGAVTVGRYSKEQELLYLLCPNDDLIGYKEEMTGVVAWQPMASSDDYFNPESAVDHPTHYAGAIECIDAIKASMTEEEYTGFLKGNVIKYMWRYRQKGTPLQDLKKAGWYLDELKKLY